MMRTLIIALVVSFSANAIAQSETTIVDTSGSSIKVCKLVCDGNGTCRVVCL